MNRRGFFATLAAIAAAPRARIAAMLKPPAPVEYTFRSFATLLCTRPGYNVVIHNVETQGAAEGDYTFAAGDRFPNASPAWVHS